MLQADFREFSGMLDAVCGLLSRGNYTPNAQNTALFFRALARHNIAVIRAAFDAHVCDPVRGKFVPVPADILAQIETAVADDGRPGAEEAWATVFAARDEALTTVWTAEMAEAAGVCRSLLLAGDEVAARMSFKEAYTRLVSTARAQRIPAAWSATLGHDIAGRDAALLPHIKAGRISNALLAGPSIGLDAAMRLPAPEGMSESNLAARAKAREKLAELRAEMAVRKGGSTAAEAERHRTQALKAEAASKVRNYTDTATTFDATGT
jgi:hypothetical protein